MSRTDVTLGVENGPKEFTRDELIARLKADGVRISPSQLHRWTDAGVIQPPVRRGLGRGRGTISVYPAITLLQVRELHRALRVRRNLDDAAWIIWMIGFPVTAYVRDLLIEEWTAELRTARATSRALKSPAVARRVARSVQRHPDALKGMLKHVRPDTVPSLARLLADMQSGELRAGHYTTNEYQLLQDGIVGMLMPEEIDAEDLPKPEEVERATVRQATVLPLPKLIDALKKISDNELCIVRNEIQELYAVIFAAIGQPEPIVPRDQFRNYFAKRAVDPDARDELRKLFHQLGWKRPPLSRLRKLLLEAEQLQREG